MWKLNSQRGVGGPDAGASMSTHKMLKSTCCPQFHIFYKESRTMILVVISGPLHYAAPSILTFCDRVCCFCIMTFLSDYCLGSKDNMLYSFTESPENPKP